MAKRSDYSDAEFGQRLQRMYDSAAQLHADGKVETHPSEHVNAWAKDIRGARDSLPGNANDPLADEDLSAQGDPSSPVSPAAANRAGGKTAQDAALEELAIRQRGGYNMEGEILAARARRGNTSSASIAAMDRAIPGYGRLK